jgi:hypothetical protein
VATMCIWMGRQKPRLPMMDQRTMWRTESIPLQSVKIGLCNLDL